MKNIKISLFGAMVMAMFMFVGCDDPCKDVTCLNGGLCVEGVCECPTGFEGDDCGTAVNAKFAGTFVLTGSMCDDGIDNDPHSVILTADGNDATEFTLGGIFDNPAGNTVNCEVDLTNTSNFTIPSQSFEDDTFGAGFTISGTGSIEGNALTVDYTITDDQNNNAVFASCTDTFQK